MMHLSFPSPKNPGAARIKCFRFGVALVLTLATAVSVDAYKQARLKRDIAPNIQQLPAVDLPHSETPPALESRVVWIDEHTFLHLQNVPSEAEGAETRPSLVRYRCTFTGNKATLHKEQEYIWPFGSALSFAQEPASEICLSADKKSLLVPLSPAGRDVSEGPHYIGLVRLTPEKGLPASALWKLKIRPRTLQPYRTFWLPDNRRFVVVLEGEGIDLYDTSRETSGVRIAADPVTGGSGSESAARVTLRDKEALGVNPAGELVLRPRPEFGNANRQPIRTLMLETLPLSEQGLREGRFQQLAVRTTSLNIIDIKDVILAPDGKRMLFLGLFTAPRFDWRLQALMQPGYVQQFAVLDLETGEAKPLFHEGVRLHAGPDHNWISSGRITRNLGPGEMKFNPQWLPGSDFVSVSANNPALVNNYSVWRVPVAGP